MFLKIIGMILVVGTSSIIGFRLSQSLEQRLRDLRIVQLALQILEKEMVFLSNSLPNALIAASKVEGNVSNIFRECGELLSKREGHCAKDAWQMSIDKHFGDTFLDDSDEEILQNLGKSLGLYDLNSQTQNIKLISSQLAIQEKKAEEIIMKNSKMYKSLGVMAGLAVAIVLA